MTITRVQYVSNASTGSGTTSLTTTIAAATSGNLLVALIATGATTSAGTTTTPTGFTALAFNPVTNTSANPAPVNIYLFYKISTGGETSVVATNTVTSGVTCQVWEFSATAGWPANPIDVSASSSNQAATTTPVTGTTATTAQAEELWIASVSTNSGTQITYSLPLNSFTQETTAWAGASPFFSPNTAGLYKIVAATGTANSGVTSSISKGFGGFVVAFKDNAGGTPITLSDTGAGTESVSINASLPLAETTIGTDSLAITASMALAETTSGADALSLQVNIPLADTGTTTQNLSLTANIPLVDTGSIVDLFASLTATVPLADIGHGSDSLSVQTGSGSSTGASLHGTTVVRPSGEVGASVARTTENGLTGVRGYLHGSTLVHPSESALSDTVRQSLTGSTVIRGG